MSNPAVAHNSHSEESDELSWVNSGLYDFPKNEPNSFQPEKDKRSCSKHAPSSEEESKKNMNFLNSDMPSKDYSLSHAYNENASENSIVSCTDLKSFMQMHSEYEFNLKKRKWECSKNIPCLLEAYPREMPKLPSNPYNGNNIKTKGSMYFENALQEKCFLINLYVETKDSHLGPFPFEIHPKTNLRLLKLQVEKELDIPASFQNWILNKTLNIDHDVPLVDYGVISKSSVFLYVDSNYKKLINEKKISELFHMKNSVTYKKNFASAPCQNLVYHFTKNVDKNSDEITTGVTTGDYQKSFINTTKFQSSEIFQKVANTNQPKRIDDSLKSSPTETDCKIPLNNSTPKSIRKTHKIGKIINGKRKNSNSSNKATGDLDELKKNGRKNPLFSVEGSDIVSSSLSDSIKPPLKENYSSSTGMDNTDHPLFATNRIETLGSVSSANCSEIVNSWFLGDSTNMDNENSGPILKRRDSKNSILKQIKKTKLQTKVSDSHEKKLYCRTEEAWNKQTPVIDFASDPHIQEFSSVSMEGLQCTRTMYFYPNGMETNPANILTNLQLSELSVTSEKSVINSSAEIAVDKSLAVESSPNALIEKSKINEVSGSFVEEANSTEILDKDVTETSNNTFEHIITDLGNEMFGHVHLNEGSEFEEKADVKESPLEIYIECTNENVNELGHTNAEEPQAELEDVNKESAENYDFLLRMENLNLVKNVLNFTCPICFNEFESDQGVVLHECLHTFCMDCLARAIDYAEEALIKCPYGDEDYSCQSYLQQREIKSLVSPEIYERYLQKSITTAESLAEKSFHCRTPDCPGWCMFEDNINVFHCPVCFHYNCLNCQAIHEGLNCRQYQDKLKKEVKLDRDSEKTLEFLNKMIEDGKAMKCPKCDLIVMKKWGCDWLKCCICQTEICWITKGPRWGPAGQGDTSAGCRCGVNKKKCHPSCTYCH